MNQFERAKNRVRQDVSGLLQESVYGVATDPVFLDGVREIKDCAGQLTHDQARLAFGDLDRRTRQRLHVSQTVMSLAYPYVPDLLRAQYEDWQSRQLAEVHIQDLSERDNVVMPFRRRAA